MRKVEIGSSKYTEVLAMDEPEFNSNHVYRVRNVKKEIFGRESMHPVHVEVRFQKGPVKEKGVNGCHQEDLIAIVIDRLQSFQKSDYSCKENAMAITKLEEAMMWLNKRTQDRINRGVEGTSIK